MTEQAITEEAKEVVEEVVTQPVEQQEEAAEPQEETHVPLAALQKERRKRQEAEAQAEWMRQQQLSQPQPAPKTAEEDTSSYEAATKGDVNASVQETVRIVEENTWIKNNPERYEQLNEQLPQFLKQRPNLANAINSATNRYSEAWELMEALTPKQKKQLKPTAPAREAPGSPTAVPKAAAMTEAVDVMTLSDSEFAEWRKSKRKAR